ALRWRGPTLPGLANPKVRLGGYVGESKAEILDLAGAAARRWIAPYLRFAPLDGEPAETAADRLLASAEAAGFAPPLVLKPDVGERGAGVQLAEDRADVVRYLSTFPAGAALIAQRLCAKEGEAGVFYIRQPGAAHGEIFSLTLKYFPYVVGDGRRRLGELIAADPRAGRIAEVYARRHADRIDWVPAAGEAVRLAFAGSHSRGAIFRDGGAFITDAMRDRFDAISADIDEFYFGRFDVRFDAIADLEAGRGFEIVEINAAGGEATHIWDRNMSIWRAWATLFRQFSKLWAVGAANRARGWRPPGVLEAFRTWRAHRALTPVYPPTH
ncbi:MAG: D-alanine--D-alanine ligase, partial [Pseudomonadota bacterium]